MCTQTHFSQLLSSPSHQLQARNRASFADLDGHQAHTEAPRFQVVLAGSAFFHIKEISTGHVRGFRANHNEACALARSLESRC
ncbi:hypothetical protein L9059_21525 [Pseudomonas sp. TNT19]|uniref:Uncharacterized protein n=1 Tax=Pseudomonas violetae TaxID=2915813 RepID=A0ABT0F3Y2_9PSED|nr:hypothetical protein [Pseudomonas violetae]MCK1792709.1 hypothetical protein [Pseudomonas violetae]